MQVGKALVEYEKPWNFFELGSDINNILKLIHLKVMFRY